LDREGREDDENHQCPVCDAARSRAVPTTHGAEEMTDIPELTEKQLARAIPARVRKRLMLGQFESGEDVVALRRFVGLSQSKFAEAMGISVHTLRNWEQGRRRPEGAAIALLRIAARHPRIIRENLRAAA
jgi:DNA-binding transcriptional regulator YiaG